MIVIICFATGCGADEAAESGEAPALNISCSNVYLDAATMQQFDYAQYIERAQDHDYFMTEMVADGREGRYHLEINLNIYLNRPDTFVEKRMIDFATYDSLCLYPRNVHPTDTVLIVRKIEGGKYSVYRVRSSLLRQITNGRVTAISSQDTILELDRHLSAGEEIRVGAGGPLMMTEVDSQGCYTFYHVERTEAGQTVRDIWLEDVLYRRDDGLRKIVIQSVDQKPFVRYLTGLCDEE